MYTYVACMHHIGSFRMGSSAVLNTKLPTNELHFADDLSLLANSDMDLQQLVNKVDGVSSRFGLTISSSKTEVQVIGRDVSQPHRYQKIGSRKDHRRNTDMMKELALDKDIVDVVRTHAACRISVVLFGWTARDIPTCYFTDTYMATVRDEGQQRDG